MKYESKEWLPIAIDYETVDSSGGSITLKNMIAEANPHTNEIRIDIDEVIRQEQIILAEEYGIRPRQLQILLFLYAKGPRFATHQPIKQKYTFNKMLFYLFKKLEELGFKRSFIHDQIECLRRGPVPVNLKEDTEELAKRKLIRLQEGGKKHQRPYVYELTDEGKRVASELWKKSPKIVVDTITKIKQDLLLLDSTALMHKVHEEYPEYRDTFVEEDRE